MPPAAWELRRARLAERDQLVTRALDGDRPEPGGGRLLCAACGAVVSHDEHRIAVDGGHRHRRRNPYGVAFEFGCFARAPGATGHGPPTTADTWFPRHAWSFATCGTCAEHLGWQFDGTDPERFFALILDRLTAE